jgi:hypothetical protein
VVIERKMANTTETAMSLPVEITGKESPSGDGSALDALIEFYRSFNASDLKALAANWADGDAPSMDNRLVVSGAGGLPSRGLCEVV